MTHTTFVVIHDRARDRHESFTINESILSKMRRAWSDSDAILAEMQATSFFAGFRRWCDLTPSHYRLMIARNLTIASEMADPRDLAHPIVQSLHFLIAGLIMCEQTRAECRIDLLVITRHDDFDVEYDVSANLVMAVEMKKRNNLRIVVNNDET